MKLSVFFITFLFVTTSSGTEPEIQKVKMLFEASADSKDAANQLLGLLSAVESSSSPLLICYKGAAEMMQAKYVFNPLNKFRSFKKGKRLIEAAVTKEPDNLEIRFLRFLIQTNLPGFLNYNDHIEQDKRYLIANLKATKDKELKQKVLKYLATSKHCSIAEKKGLST
ncbi:hypothetical protein [Pedobacter foliorum]|uniref:hypothetical protein n=1 Tax=Pedobacter foliorum TaxID=2739058 RepID=UPI0015676A73|nr:hypothetical protein [Pedobacter foliorum]NRF37643.1 hypothetical protein [Pedobacter foliorum]